MVRENDQENDQRAGRLLVLAGWTVLLVLSLGALHALGRGPLAPPPLARPGALAAWLDRRSPPTLAFCALRLAAMGSAGYLLATTLAGVLARIAGRARWSAATDAISPLVVRRLVEGAAGLTVAATVTASQAAAWASPGVSPGASSPTPIMRRLPSALPSTTTAAPRAPAPMLPRTDPSTPPAPTSSAPPATWVIRPGDNLWSVAETTLVRAWGRVPSDTEVDDYWTGLIAVNRVRLAHGDDPDLVFPGQVFELPTPPSAAQR